MIETKEIYPEDVKSIYSALDTGYQIPNRSDYSRIAEFEQPKPYEKTRPININGFSKNVKEMASILPISPKQTTVFLFANNPKTKKMQEDIKLSVVKALCVENQRLEEGRQLEYKPTGNEPTKEGALREALGDDYEASKDWGEKLDGNIESINTWRSNSRKNSMKP